MARVRFEINVILDSPPTEDQAEDMINALIEKIKLERYDSKIMVDDCYQTDGPWWILQE